MRFLANENFPRAAIAALEKAGHDVAWVRIVAPGASDSDVLTWAAREERILRTFDKDFGEAARNATLPAACGVVLFRIPMPMPGEGGIKLADALRSRDDWVGHFSVVEPGRVRMRPLSTRKSRSP